MFAGSKGLKVDIFGDNIKREEHGRKTYRQKSFDYPIVPL